MRGEKIYEYDFDVTGVTDHGVTLEAILSGQVKVPPQGVRADLCENVVLSTAAETYPIEAYMQ